MPKLILTKTKKKTVDVNENNVRLNIVLYESLVFT